MSNEPAGTPADISDVVQPDTPSGEMDIVVGAVKETPEWSGQEGENHEGKEGKTFTLDEDKIQNERAKREAEEAAKVPPGLSKEQVEALEAAGYSIQAPEGEKQEAEAVEPKSPDEMADALNTPEPAGPLTMESLQKYTEEFATSGSLGDESRDEIKKAHNIDDAVLDQILGGIKAQSQTLAVDALAEIGATWSDFQSWAAWSVDNESEAVRDSRQQQMRSTDPEVRKTALNALRMAAGADAPTPEPELVRGGPSFDMRGKNFDSILSEAMRDRRYHMQNEEGDRFRASIEDALAKKAGG